MSGTTFEVAASFRIEDLASPVLARLSASITDLADLVEKTTRTLSELGKGVSLQRLTNQAQALVENLGGLDRAAGDASAALDRTSTAGVTALDRITTAATEAKEAVLAIGAAGRDMGVLGAAGGFGGGRGAGAGFEEEAAAFAAGRGFGGGGGGGEGGGGFGGFFRGMGRNLESFAFSPPALLAGLSIEHALKQAGSEDLAIRTAEQSLGITNPDSPQGRAAYDMMRRQALAAAQGPDGQPGTIFTEAQTASAMSQFIKLTASSFGATPEERLKNATQSFPVVLKAAEVATNQGLGTLAQNLEAFTTYAHETRRYAPGPLTEGTNSLLTVAETIGRSPYDVARSLKYSVPLGNLDALNPDSITALTGFVMQSGMSGTTAGTGVGQILMGLMNSGGPINAHLESQRGALEKALGLKAGESRERPEVMKGHRGGLQELGLIDAQGRSTVADAAGVIDIFKAIEKIEQYAQTHDHRKTMDAITTAFSLRGSRAIAPFVTPEGMEQWQNYQRYYEQQKRDFPAEFRQELSAKSPMQQFEQLWARINDTLNNLVQPGLKGLGDAAQKAADALGRLNEWLQSHTQAASSISRTAIGAAAGAGIGSIIPGVGTLFGGFTGGLYGYLSSLAPQTYDPNKGPLAVGPQGGSSPPFDPGNVAPPNNLLHHEAFETLGGPLQLDSGVYTTGVPLGTRLNNPLNIRSSALETGSYNGFAAFASQQQGIEAAEKQLLLYQDRDHLNTIRQIISKWAPPSENDTAGYINFVSGKTGIKPDEKIDLHDPAVMSALMHTMAQKETGSNLGHGSAARGVGGGLNVNVEVVGTFPTVDELIAAITRKLSQALTHNTGVGWGSHQSAFSVGVDT